MDTWDNAQPDRDQPIGDASASPEEPVEPKKPVEPVEPVKRVEPPKEPAKESAEPAKETSEASPDLHYALSLIADTFASAPHGDMYPDMYSKVMARATRIRRRRRAVRAGSATAVLVMAALLGPSIAAELGVRGGDASAAPPPSAIVDLTSAYPVPTAWQDSNVVAAAPALPENALPWPSRGTALPEQAVDVAKSYLLDQAARTAAKTGQGSVTTATTTATVAPLWSQVDDDTTAPAATGHTAASKAASQTGHKTWLYVMQGWTTGADGASSQAQLLVGDYTQTGKASSMSVYAAPVTFAHARPGSSDDADDAEQIAELSVFLPQSGRLVVLGAPQTKTVLYAKTGGDLVPERTDDGVAVFPRTHRLVKGQYADTIQVRDANNVALTPPKAWSAGDYVLSGPMGWWSSGAAGWVMVPARSGAKPTVPPGTTPPITTSRPATTSGGAPTSAPAPTASGGGDGSVTPSPVPGTASGSSGTAGSASSS